MIGAPPLVAALHERRRRSWVVEVVGPGFSPEFRPKGWLYKCHCLPPYKNKVLNGHQEIRTLQLTLEKVRRAARGHGRLAIQGLRPRSPLRQIRRICRPEGCPARRAQGRQLCRHGGAERRQRNWRQDE